MTPFLIPESLHERDERLTRAARAGREVEELAPRRTRGRRARRALGVAPVAAGSRLVQAPAASGCLQQRLEPMKSRLP